ncbi:MAG: TusE/DsrC/DsvC family sulfur relay protein [Hyphomicrobiaceae bacterium]|nr:TusE/DsrC/DsvC family sulfur relay protein [Hyphomicrobiaceae bacterium]MCC0011293.1 TusE/DsrC/DsvC family sulfur relay protein [Hyphomicrobiaceae bacterium]
MRTRPDAISELAVGDKVVHLDEHGYVIDPEEWDEATAEELARRQNIQLTNDHWDVIRFMREFLAEHGVAADARFVMRFLEERAAGSGRSGREILFELFPYGYVGQACRISGMRQPRAWSTG